MKDFFNIRGYEVFVRDACKLFTSTLEEFLSVEVKLYFKPTSELLDYKVDISLNPERSVYQVDSNNVLIISHASVEEERFYLGIKLTAAKIANLTKIFNSISRGVTSCLTQCTNWQFTNSIAEVGDRLIIRIISFFFDTGRYSIANMMHIIDKFIALRSTTFEGKHFSTGLIVTYSFHEYKKGGVEGRNGLLLSLNRPMDYHARIDNRYWYLADGVRTFYVTNLRSPIKNLFVYEGTDGDHFKNMVLYNAVKGGDVLIRTEAGREVSVISSDGVEFVNQENTWRYRDYALLKERITKEVALDDEVYNSLLYYVLFCSKNDISSLIWMPKDIKTYKDALKEGTINKFARTSFYINDQSYSPLVKRMLSSDGATIIRSTGEIEAFGCMVDMSSAEPTGIKGTGETAAGMLAKNGFAIKISQDGTIKVFLNGRDKAIKF